YEKIEEDRLKKTPELLEYNPVYKRILVLVHSGKSISELGKLPVFSNTESMIILEYMDQVWPHNPLFPPHPYHKALARFWLNYCDHHLSGGVRALFRSNEVEGRKKVIENIWEHLRVVEDQCFSKENKFFGGDSVNVLDLAFGSIIKYLTVLEDIFGVQILEEHKFPHLYSWFNIFKTQPIIAQNLPHQDQMVAFVESLREQILSSSS
ncbi:hypothetical protein PHAVU_007G134800, partial [Phaseolus vulgaris]